MQRSRNRDFLFSLSLKKHLTFHRLSCLICITFCVSSFTQVIRGETLSDHLKRLTSALSSRNLDSLKQLIDPSRIYVEIAPKEGAYLSPSQTLGVVESFFQSHQSLSFTYVLVKEEGKTGIAIGTLVVAESGRKIPHKVNFGFQKSSLGNWLLSTISIR